MGAKLFGYARVSSTDQNLNRQIDALKKQGIDERDIYADQASGKNFNRDKYSVLMQILREGDTLFVTSLDRLGRNYTDIQKQWEHITQEIKADIVVLDMPLLDTRGSSTGNDLDKRFIANLTLQILSYVAEKERINIKERQRQGIDAAKARGTHLGRPKAVKPANWDEIIAKWDAGSISSNEAIELTGTTRSTFYRLLKR